MNSNEIKFNATICMKCNHIDKPKPKIGVGILYGLNCSKCGGPTFPVYVGVDLSSAKAEREIAKE